MTRDEALLKLLAMEPETKDNLIRVTGWPETETRAVIERLLRQHRIGYTNWTGRKGSPSKRLYLPKEACRA